jgi:hypothetical protein
METETTNSLKDALLDALTLGWVDNGNIMADAVRDSCTEVLAHALGMSTVELEAMIRQRIIDNQ